MNQAIRRLGGALLGAALCARAMAQDPEAQQRLLQTVEDLRQRVEELEDQQAKVAERIGGRAVAQAYTARNLDVGGHVTSLFTHEQGDNGSATGHVVSLLELYVKAHLDDHWSLFATPGFYIFNGGLLDDPNTTVAGDPAFTPTDSGNASLFLSRAQAQWRLGDVLQMQGGIVGSPHGTTNREYFIPARTIGQANLHTRVFLTNQLYPQKLNGLRASGKYSVLPSHRIEYDAYVGDDDREVGIPMSGARLAWVFEDIKLGVAANYGAGRRSAVTGADLLANVPILQAPFAANWNGARNYQFVGIDVDWRYGDFIAKTEAYVSNEDGYKDQRALSSEWTWFAADHVGFSYRFDYYDRGSDQTVVGVVPTITTAAASLGFATEHVFGLCYDPNPSVRLRLDYHHLLLPNTAAHADFVNLSWSVSF